MGVDGMQGCAPFNAGIGSRGRYYLTRISALRDSIPLYSVGGVCLLQRRAIFWNARTAPLLPTAFPAVAYRAPPPPLYAVRAAGVAVRR